MPRGPWVSGVVSSGRSSGSSRPMATSTSGRPASSRTRQRVRRDLAGLDVARHAGHRHQLGLGRRRRVQEREAVVDPGVDVEDQRDGRLGHGAMLAEPPTRRGARPVGRRPRRRAHAERDAATSSLVAGRIATSSIPAARPGAPDDRLGGRVETVEPVDAIGRDDRREDLEPAGRGQRRPRCPSSATPSRPRTPRSSEPHGKRDGHEVGAARPAASSRRVSTPAGEEQRVRDASGAVGTRDASAIAAAAASRPMTSAPARPRRAPGRPGRRRCRDRGPPGRPGRSGW